MQYKSLNEFKENKQITNSDLASMFGTSEIYISLLLNKKRVPSRKLAQKISKKTGIPILNLLFPNREES